MNRHAIQGTICLVILTIALSGCASALRPAASLEDLLIPTDPASLSILPDDTAVRLFERYRADFEVLSDAVERGEPMWMFEPYAERIRTMGYPMTVSIAAATPAASILCGICRDPERFDQSFRYAADPSTLPDDSEFDSADHTFTSTDLGSGWYYCLDIRHELKYRDQYIAAAIGWLVEAGYDRESLEAGEWTVALQTWEQAMSMARRTDGSRAKRSEWAAVVRHLPADFMPTDCPDVMVLPLTFGVVARSGGPDTFPMPADLLEDGELPEPAADERTVTAYFRQHREVLLEIADYLQTHEKEIGTRPVYIRRGWTPDLEQLPDERIRTLTATLLEDGIVSGIESLNDGAFRYVVFRVESVTGRYENGIRFRIDPEGYLDGVNALNEGLRETRLEDGWSYYLQYSTEVRNADWYRRMVWERIRYGDGEVTHPWRQAEVALVAWDDTRYRYSVMDGTDQACDFLVSVTFRTVDDAMLGPIRAYIRPDTLELMGFAGRE